MSNAADITTAVGIRGSAVIIFNYAVVVCNCAVVGCDGALIIFYITVVGCDGAMIMFYITVVGLDCSVVTNNSAVVGYDSAVLIYNIAISCVFLYDSLGSINICVVVCDIAVDGTVAVRKIEVVIYDRAVVVIFDNTTVFSIVPSLVLTLL